VNSPHSHAQAPRPRQPLEDVLIGRYDLAMATVSSTLREVQEGHPRNGAGISNSILFKSVTDPVFASGATGRQPVVNWSSSCACENVSGTTNRP
jgi:hypothetical protein